MRTRLAWLRSHPIISTITGLIALCVCGHFFLNWKAERRWQTYVKEGRARGVKFDLAEFSPPPIPDEENFAALPMMRAAAENDGKSPLTMPSANRPSRVDFAKGKPVDWQKWSQYFQEVGFISEVTDSPPSDVLRALEHYAPQFQEWSQWRTRPRCRFVQSAKTVKEMSFPYLSVFYEAANVFTLRAQAHLALGNPAAAYSDFRDALHGYFALKEEPTLIAGLVKISCLRTALSVVGEGLRRHSWSDAELQTISADLRRVQIWEDYVYAFSSERAFGVGASEQYMTMSWWDRAKAVAEINALPEISEPPIPFGYALLIPDRMFRDNLLRENRYMDELLARVSNDDISYDPDGATPSAATNLEGNDKFWFNLFLRSAPVFSRVGMRFALLKTHTDLALTSVAIERFRIARGTLPETLADLTPSFISAIPADTYSHSPLIYRREGLGSFSLYSVGPNRRDDGGAIDIESNKSESDQLDWVWPYSRD